MREFQTAAALVLLAAGTAWAESLTRDEIVENAISGIGFAARDHGEIISEADREAIVNELGVYARTAHFIPEIMDGLPEGSRAAIFRYHVSLSSADREYCKAVVKAHLMAQVAMADGARVMPMLTGADQERLLAMVDVFLEKAGASLSKHVGGLLSDAELKEDLQKLRDVGVQEARNPVLVSFKRIPTLERIEAVAADFDSRLADADSRIKEAAGRMLPQNGSPDYGERRASFRSWLRAQTIEPLRALLSKETGIDEAPFKLRADESVANGGSGSEKSRSNSAA